MTTISELTSQVGVATACQALAVPRSSFYRSRQSSSPKADLSLTVDSSSTVVSPPLPVRSPRSLSEEEKSVVRETLNSPRFVDQTPREVYATLLDEERYLCSWRTMYRILEQNQEVRERRAQLRHPTHAKPELVATAPNQLWSWDITKLLGPTKGTFYYLYVIIDVFSRYITGWLLADCESDVLAEQLVRETCIKQRILPNQLTLHADRGSSMKSKLLALLLADLGVTKTHSRPRVSNDNPYSESQFKTMKYAPTSRISSVRWRMPGHGSDRFLIGTTTSIITALWDYSRRPLSIMARRPHYSKNVRASWMPLMPLILSALSKKHPPCSHYLIPCGLTAHSRCWRWAPSLLL
jgi:putative transposase